MRQTTLKTAGTVLAIETSCDETAVAILRGSQLLASKVASQIAEHQKYGGVVPEVASRNHLVHMPRLLEQAFETAGIGPDHVDAFAATSGPGLASSLMIGASAAKGLAIAAQKPFLAINHLEGHLLSPFMGSASVRSRDGSDRSDAGVPLPQHIALIVSGGHTLLIHVRAVGQYEILGRTVDDAAGEAFDKVAKLLGLGYPGGPEIESHAQNGNSKRYDFPRSMSGSSDFSFSGLKTAVRYLLPKISSPPGAFSTEVLVDVCASFQQAVIDVLVAKTLAVAKTAGVSLVTISGGVSCNRALRKQMQQACDQVQLDLKVAEPTLCTDNAAMIAFAAMLRLRNGFSSSVEEEIDPNLGLT